MVKESSTTMKFWVKTSGSTEGRNGVFEKKNRGVVAADVVCGTRFPPRVLERAQVLEPAKKKSSPSSADNSGAFGEAFGGVVGILLVLGEKRRLEGDELLLDRVRARGRD